MARAVIAQELGPPENYRLVAFDPGPPKAGEVRIAIKAAGISFVDVLTAGGGYQVKPPVPFIPGSECAGVVDALGDGVTGFAVGDAVIGSNWGGVFADVINLPAVKLSIIPYLFPYCPPSRGLLVVCPYARGIWVQPRLTTMGWAESGLSTPRGVLGKLAVEEMGNDNDPRGSRNGEVGIAHCR